MTLAVFDAYLIFAEGVMSQSASLPATIDVNELESALTGYGVVLLHSHMELCIRAAVVKRCERITDKPLCSFANSIIDEKTSRLNVQSLKQTLNRFAGTYKDTFHTSIDSAGLNGSWDSILNHRKAVAHEGKPALLSLADLRGYYADVRKVLDAYCDALELEPHEKVDVLR